MTCPRVDGAGEQREGRSSRSPRTFGVDWPHLTAQTISFGIVCALLYWLAYKPVLRMLDERRQQIAQGLANTEKINAALAGIEAQRQGVLAEAQAQSTPADRRGARRRRSACGSRRAQRARLPPPSRSCRRRSEAAAQEHARMLAELRQRSRPAGRADHGRRHRKGADGRRSAAPGRGNGAAADGLDASRDATMGQMKTAETGAA